jgi:hypothetical protein
LSYGASLHSRLATSACWRPCPRPDLLESTLLLPEQFDYRLVSPLAHRRPECERLLSAPAMSQQKPSELLAEIMRICSGGEETSVFFLCLFLQKMPMSLRILLSEAGMADSQLFRRRVDQIWAHQPSLHHVTVAAVSLKQVTKTVLWASFSPVRAARMFAEAPSRVKETGGVEAQCPAAANSGLAVQRRVSATLPSHVAVVQDFLYPETVKELETFFGTVNFYRSFLPAVAKTIKLLTGSLRDDQKRTDISRGPLTVLRLLL